MSSSSSLPGPELLGTDEPDVTSTDDRTVLDLRGDGCLVSLGRYRYLSARGAMPVQRHVTLLVLALPVRGSVDFGVDDDALTVSPRQVLCIPPGFGYVAGRDTQTRGELLWLVVRLRPSVPAGEPGAGTAVDEVARRLALGGVGVWTAPALAVELLEQALLTPEDGRWAVVARRRALCAAALLDLAVARADAHEPPSRATGPAARPGVRRALALVEAHADLTLGVGDLVAVSGLSTSKFYDAFSEAVGTSPKDYVLQQKVAAAKSRLADQHRTVTEVAHSLGFSSGQHFADVFRRYTGTTPSAYREQLGRPPAPGAD